MQRREAVPCQATDKSLHYEQVPAIAAPGAAMGDMQEKRGRRLSEE
jgi:hypothetical protein